MELHGLVFAYRGPNKFSVLDLTYGIDLGIFHLVEGPGWILDFNPELKTPFLDTGQMATLIEFANLQNKDTS